MDIRSITQTSMHFTYTITILSLFITHRINYLKAKRYKHMRKLITSYRHANNLYPAI